jgi:tRNA(fMet)-specific endonuclease VapC
MAWLIDTSVFIELDRRGAPLHELAASIPVEPAALASITVSELLVGAHRAATARQRSQRLDYVESILSQMPVLPFDVDSAKTHARLFSELRAVGQSIGSNDLIIAATALTHGYAVLTHNLRHFERVPGLAVQQPRLRG